MSSLRNPTIKPMDSQRAERFETIKTQLQKLAEHAKVCTDPKCHILEALRN